MIQIKSLYIQTQLNITISIFIKNQMTGMSEKEKTKTLEKLRETSAKINSYIHKSRAKTIITINKQREQLLFQVN
jgi:hypothetical protein